MTDKELQKLKRVEVLEILVEQGKEIDRLHSEVEALKKQLADREIRLESAGNIAEASLQINGVFEAAQSAAQQYLENIQRLSDRQESVCADMEQRTKEACETMERATREKCDALYQKAQLEADERWSDLSSRLEEFYDAHKGLRELLDATGNVLIK